MIEDPAEPVPTDHPPWRQFWNALDQPIVEALMRSLEEVMLHELSDRSPRMTIRLRHSDLIESTNHVHHSWVPRPSLRAAVVLLGDESAIPAEDCVRRDDRAQLAKDPASERLSLRSKPASLVICESQLPPDDLLARHAVLFLEVLDDGELLLVKPNLRATLS